MLRLSKILVSVTLLMILIFPIGCTADTEEVSLENGPDNNILKYETKGKAVISPIEIPYVTENSIDIININASNSDRYRQSYFKIDGLVNQTVEDKINKDIKELFDKMVPYTTGEKLPPYRGIQSKVQSDKKIDSSYIAVIPYFNSNNVLSIVAHADIDYFNVLRNDHVYFSMIDSMNIDLNTGEEFLIEDLFANDVDGISIVNDAIVEDIGKKILYTDVVYDEYTSLALVAPFKGISNTQKFYLTYEGVNVIIDYNNPEFDVGFGYGTVSIPFSSLNKQIAITERFYDDEHSIFTFEPVGKRFLSENQWTVGDNYNESYNKDDVLWHVFISRPKNLSQNLIDIIEDFQIEVEKMVTSIQEEIPVTGVEQYLFSYQTGKYINISNQLIITGTNSGDWLEQKYVYSDKGELIEIDDIFADGYDYTSLLKRSIDKAVADYGLTEDVDKAEIYDNLMFNLNDSYISFIADFEKGNNNHGPINFSIFYKDIGYKNLIIFD